jgi:diguanylate cyclase (GGDEF)-like protein
MPAIDLATVLLLHASSLATGAFGIVIVRRRCPRTRGLGKSACAFILLGAGGVLAAFGERGHAPAVVWTHLSLLLGTGGYALLWLGIAQLSGGAPRRHQHGVACIPAAWFVAGLVTQFPLDDTIRASVFHFNALAFLGAAAWRVWGDGEAEPLRSRHSLSLCLAVSGAVYLVRGLLILTRTPSLFDMAQGFFAQILCDFVIALMVMAMVTERTEIRLRLAMETDELTRVGNRRYLLARLPKRVLRGSAIAVVDADHFKRINDTHGHTAGDRVLVATAQSLQRQLRDHDVLARIGGEEFAIFFPNVREADARDIAERLRREVALQRIDLGSTVIGVTVSIGLAWIDDAGTTWTEWIARADAACYAAKQNGRNCVSIARPDAPATSGRR